MLFIDESGISLVPFVAKTWALRGQTPVLVHRFNWSKLSMISSVTPRGKVYFRLHENAIRMLHVRMFLQQILRHIRRKPVMVFWDNARPHIASIVREFAENHRRLEVHQLPPYFYEGNPDEGFWSVLKTKELANFCPRDIEELKAETKKAVNRIRRKPNMVKSFFRKSPLFQLKH
jgi:putative transposase